MDRKDGIITEIYTSGILETLMKNMNVKEHDQDDLKQEIAMILLYKDKEQLINLYEKKQLKFWLVKIIQNQYYSCHSPYYKTYKKYYKLIDGNIMNGEMEENEECVDGNDE